MGYEAVLAFDGRRYRYVPPAPPATRIRRHAGGTVLIDLRDATRATSGGKAALLAALLRAGLAVPPGFVVPMSVYEHALAGVDLVGAAGEGAHHARREG